MRLAAYFGPVVVGLPILIGQIVVVPPVARAWQPFASPTAAAAAPSAGERGGQRTRPAGKGALFHGQEIRLPAMPFARNRPAGRPGQPKQRSFFGMALPGASEQNPPRAGGRSQVAARQMPQRMSSSPSAAPMNSPRNQVAMARRPMRTSREVPIANPNTSAARAPIANHSAATPTLTEPAMPQTIEPKRVARTATASLPESLADRLIAQAHDSTSTAESEADFSQIIETCRRARASQPSAATAGYAHELTSWAFNRRGQLKAEAGRDQEAILDFDDSIRADPKRWRPIHNRGVLLAQSGEFERAFDDFTRTIQINPEYAKAYSNRAALCMVAGNLSPAMKDYTRAIGLDPELSVAHRGCARVCHLIGKLEEAIEHYDAAVQLAPEDAYAVASRADLLTDLGRYAEALAGYERAIELDPKSSQAHSGSAWLLATCPDSSVRNPELSIERAQTAIQLSGKEDALSFDTLAAAQANAGDFSAAMHTIRQAVELAPADEREVYEDRLLMYQHAKPYRIAPVGEATQITQASYESY